MQKNDSIWSLYKPNAKKIADIEKEYGLSKMVSTIIANRFDKEEVLNFLNVSETMLHSPFLFNDMEKAVNRIIKAIDEKKRIIIYGDYDVDGVTATSIVYNYLISKNADVSYYLPSRFEEGYGLNIEAMDKLCEQNLDLLITVDCGIASVNEVKFLNDKGVDVIITDHHECQEILPNAFAIINPKRKDSTYPFSSLCGAGVAFKLVQAIENTISKEDRILYEYIDFACLATIADIVPLVDENRAIVKLGMDKLKNTSNFGLKNLIEISGVKDFTTFSVGFALAPRINAAGRMGIASRAVELFTTLDEIKAKELAIELDEENKNRQVIEAGLMDKIIKEIEENRLYDNKVMVISGEGWHHGIIGIIASKLVDRYYRPCIIISFENGIGTGSLRSVDGVNIFELLTNVGDLLVKFGGHELAAGLTINEENFEKFKSEIFEVSKDFIDDKKLRRNFKVEYLLDKEDLSIDKVEELSVLEPYGCSNPQPFFGVGMARIEDIITLSDNKHLKLRLSFNNKIIYAIGFGMGSLASDFNIFDYVGVVGNLTINEFNDTKSVQIILKDIKKING